MPKPNSLKKYLRIVKLLQGPLHYYPLSRIKQHLKEHGFNNLSDRTLLRDFDTLQEEFGVPMEYCQSKKGWHLNLNTDQDLEDYNHFLKLLEFSERVETITQTFRHTSYASRFILFEQKEHFKGSNHLPLIIEAIIRKVVIIFNYFSYEKEKTSIYNIEPFLVKEYSNRWYLLGWDKKANKLKTFGLDRIENISITDQIISSNRGFHYETMFKHTYGITCLDEEPEEIILSFTPKQGNYIKSLPLHSSQQILIDSKEECRVCLKVIINHELKKEILSYGEDVKVLEPPALQEEIKERLKKALKTYQP